MLMASSTKEPKSKRLKRVEIDTPHPFIVPHLIDLDFIEIILHSNVKRIYLVQTVCDQTPTIHYLKGKDDFHKALRFAEHWVDDETTVRPRLEIHQYNPNGDYDEKYVIEEIAEDRFKCSLFVSIAADQVTEPTLSVDCIPDDITVMHPNHQPRCISADRVVFRLCGWLSDNWIAAVRVLYFDCSDVIVEMNIFPELHEDYSRDQLVTNYHLSSLGSAMITGVEDWIDDVDELEVFLFRLDDDDQHVTGDKVIFTRINFTDMFFAVPYQST